MTNTCQLLLHLSILENQGCYSVLSPLWQKETVKIIQGDHEICEYHPSSNLINSKPWHTQHTQEAECYQLQADNRKTGILHLTESCRTNSNAKPTWGEPLQTLHLYGYHTQVCDSKM